MDKQLLNALDNLSLALEKIAELMAKKDDGSAKSDITKALQSGNFIEEIKEINIGVKEIKKDTQEILKQQKTIIEMSKQKESDKKTGDIETDPKKESAIKKGVASILLIAVAVLAIGMAFKLVGKVDFISVLGLGIAIVLVATAFEKVAKLGLTPKQALDTSIVMILMSGGVLVSSLILSKMAVISIQQALTAIFIGTLFLIIGPSLAGMIKSMITGKEILLPNGTKMKSEGLDFGTIVKSAIVLPIVMIGMALGIMFSSIILSKITPLSITQALTAILITGVFAIAASGIVKLITTLEKEKISVFQAAGMAFALPILMIGFSAGIWLSSMFLNKVQPIGFPQVLASIFISAIFVVASFGLAKIMSALKDISPGKAVAAAIMLPLILPAMSAAIWLSSYLLSKVQPLKTEAFVSALMISALFVVLSLAMKPIIGTIGKLDWKDIPKIPVFFVIVALALAGAAFILSSSQKYFNIDYSIMLKILVFGAILGVIGIVMGFATKVIGTLTWKSVALAPAFFLLVTLAIAGAAFIIYNTQKYFNMEYTILLKILAFGVILGIIGIVMGIATKIIEMVSWSAVIKAPVFFTLISIAIALSAFIIYQSVKYLDGMAFSTLIKLLVFSVVLGISVVVMGIVAKILDLIGGVATYIKGGLAILILATTIMLSSKILNLGDYKNYPSLKWILGVGASLLAFGVAAALLGLAVFGPQAIIFLAGLGATLAVATTIVAVSKIIAKGDYKAPGILPWAISVALLYGAFVPAIVVLGALGLAGGVLKFFGAEDPFEKAKKMMVQIAQTIVDVAAVLAKGKYIGGPTKTWAEGVSIALGAFSPIYAMLMANGVMKIFGGGGVGPEDFAKAIKTVSQGIMYAAKLFASPDNPGVWKGGPPKKWAEGVGLAIGAFSPVLKILSDGAIISLFGGKGVSAEAMKGAIISISQGIVEAAKFFAKNTAAFTDNYPKKQWGEGVGAALGAFAPVFTALQGKGFFSSGKDVIDDMKMGILTIADSIVKVSFMLNGYTLSKEGVLIPGKNKPDFTVYPTKEWNDGIMHTINTFSTIFLKLSLQKGGAEAFRQNSMMLSSILSSMASTAGVINKNKGAFNTNIPATWVKNASSNILAFAELTKKIAATQKGGLGGLFDRLTGGDPMSQLAGGMTKVAVAYDALARSLQKFGNALSSIDGQKVSLIKNLTGNIAVLSAMDAEMFSKVMQVLESKASIFSKLITSESTKGGPTVGDKKTGGKSETAVSVKSAKPVTKEIGEQLDDILKVLKQISYNTSGLDDWLAKQGFAADKQIKL